MKREVLEDLKKESYSSYLLIRSERHHELRLSKRQYIATINLPEMVCLSVETDDFSHLFCFGYFPDCVGDGWVREDEHAGLDLDWTCG